MIDGLDKIRVKGSAKRYKRGPGPTGAARLDTPIARALLVLVGREREPGMEG